jgi:N-acetyl-alpha-D-muramate 1-phosphate uridylyltransferase
MAGGHGEGCRGVTVEAMIFAAGLGTRLGPITRDLPKALVSVGGVPMLERVATRLVDAGVGRLIINTHHFTERIVEFVESRVGFGVEVVFSHEVEAPLETGGGLRRAAPLFRADAPFFLHNADVLSDLPLAEIRAVHLARAPLATLAVMRRESSRFLLFDDLGLLGRADSAKDLRIEARPQSGEVQELAFAGVHVVSPTIFALLPEAPAFSILDAYLSAVEQGHRIDPFRVDDYAWIDIGKPEQLEDANERTRM